MLLKVTYAALEPLRVQVWLIEILVAEKPNFAGSHWWFHHQSFPKPEQVGLLAV